MADKLSRWISIFRTGTWTDSAGHTKTWTKADLDKTVAATDLEARGAPMVVGHPQNDSPAYGWVAKLRRSGEILQVRFRKLNKAIEQAVDAGNYEKLSSAFRTDGSLKHVGLLGAAAPAVPGLGRVKFTGPADERVFAFNAADLRPQQQEDKGMPTEQLKKELEAAQAKIAKLEADGAHAEAFAAKDKEIAALEAKVKAAEGERDAVKKEFAERQATAVTAAREARFSALVASGKAVEGDKVKLMAFAEQLGQAEGKDKPTLAFSDKDGKTESVGLEEAFWRELERGDGHGLFSEHATHANAGTPADGGKDDVDTTDINQHA